MYGLSLLFLLLAVVVDLSNASAGEQVDLTLRMRWNAPAPKASNFSVSVVDQAGQPALDASIRDLANLSLSPATTGAFRVDESRSAFQFNSRAKLSEGGARFRVQASDDAQLAVEFIQTDDDGNATRMQEFVPLNKLLAKTLYEGKKSNTASHESWSLQRVATDQLRIELAKQSPLFRKGDDLSFSVQANSAVSATTQSLSLHYNLVRVGHATTVNQESWTVTLDANGHSDKIEHRHTVPHDPGVYELRCWLEPSENLWSHFRRRPPPTVYHARPIVVLPDAGVANSPTPWETIGEIRPSQVATWSVSKWLPKSTNRLIPGSAPTEPKIGTAQHAGESVSQLLPGESFQATVPVQTPGLPHRVTVRYPNDDDLQLRIDVAPSAQMESPEVSFTLNESIESPTLGDWIEHTFVVYPRNDDQIRLTNVNADHPVKFESIIVTAGPDHLSEFNDDDQPAVDLQTRLGAIELTDIDWYLALTSDVARQRGVIECQPQTIAMQRLWSAAGRLRDYAQASGFNSLVIPVVDKGRCLIRCDAFSPIRDEPSIDDDALDLLLAVWEHSNLRVLLSVDPSMPVTALETALQQTPESSQTLLRRSASLVATPNYARYHPMVWQAKASLLKSVCNHAARSTCFEGIHLRNSAADVSTIDDCDLALFASKVNPKSVSIAQLRRWVGGEGRPAFEQWIADRSIAKLSLFSQQVPRPHRLVVQATGHPIADVKNRLPNIQFRQAIKRSPDGPLSKRIRFAHSLSNLDADQNDSISVVSLVDDATTSSPTPTLRRISSNHIGAIIRKEAPDILMLRSSVVGREINPQASQLLQSFTALPRGKLTAVPMADPALSFASVQFTAANDRSYLVVTNDAPWQTEVDIDCGSPAGWKPMLEAGPNTASISDSGSQTRVTLQPGQCIILQSKVPLPDSSAISCTARVAGGAEALAEIKQSVSTIVARIGMLTNFDDYEALSNGSFEQKGGVGLVGWLHAQHPADAVTVDQQESIDGDRSVCLTTDAQFSSRTWLVSETFAAPTSGRIAVSLACRGQLRNAESKHQLRVSIEGTQNGQPLRKSAEIEVPRDGKWQSRQVVLEVDGITPSAVESLRLTIDSMSAGKIWIDDVHLHHEFPLSKERGDLQSQAFLAVQGLERGNLTPSARLLKNHWAQLLLREAELSPPPVVAETVDPPEPTPGVAERIRGWLPRPLRF